MFVCIDVRIYRFLEFSEILPKICSYIYRFSTFLKHFLNHFENFGFCMFVYIYIYEHSSLYAMTHNQMSQFGRLLWGLQRRSFDFRDSLESVLLRVLPLHIMVSLIFVLTRKARLQCPATLPVGACDLVGSMRPTVNGTTGGGGIKERNFRYMHNIMYIIS